MPATTEEIRRIVREELRTFTHENLWHMPDIAGINRDHDNRYELKFKNLATYTATNVTTDRSYDADTVLVAELADVVGTLIADLRALGLVK